MKKINIEGEEMENKNKLETLNKIFEGNKVRVIWEVDKEEYFFSVIDVVRVLTDSANPRRYWSDLKIMLSKEGSELYDFIVQLRMRAPDGKMRLTDTLDTEGVFRLIQSIPSPKAEPLKLWLAKLGRERIDETFDPEIAIHRAIEIYRKKG
jgi:prophage antirepressor-like protein